MNPFFFGAAERRLFGVYEPAAGGTAGKRAAILCNPWGAEYIYGHRTLRQLSLKLSRSGFHTLRFDYYGTGDSGGEPIDTDLAGSQADLETAIEELTEITGLTKVTLIGMRLGGAVAAEVASRLGHVIETLVLWDPVLSGPEFLDRLGLPTNTKPPIETQGFPISAKMVRELKELDLSVSILKSLPRTLMLVTERLPSHVQLMQMTSESGAPAIEILTGMQPWLESSVESGMVPVPLLERILNWLE